MILQLNPQIPVMTPKGSGQAVLIIDYSEEHHILWTVFLDEGGECWTFKNSEIRGIPNQTMGRVINTDSSAIYPYLHGNYPKV